MNAVDLLKLKKYLEDRYPVRLKLECDSDAYDNPSIYLVSIVIKKNKRKQGIGTQVMQELINYANKEKVPITLNPVDILGTDLKILIPFYLKFGFKMNRSKRRFNEDMYYIPK